MPNSIALAQKCLPMLDEVYKYASKSAVLDAANGLVQFVGANAVKVFKLSMDGLGDYSRNNGFVDGDVTGSWETLTLQKDRGRSFMVDAMDDEETLRLAFGKLAGEFIRTKVAPEIDAYTFAKLAGNAGLTTTAADITVGTTDVPTLVETGERAADEAEVPKDGRILFISETAYAGLKNKITRYTENREGVYNNNIEYFNDMRVIRVPQSRFYTAITLYNGTSTGQTAGGYAGTASTGYKINFMIVHPSAVVKVAKHVMPRIFTPQENQKADAWKFDYRIYHDTFVLDNKVNGIYLHRGSTALS